MNRRLQQFLSAENISQAQFADTIGVARASVSHILAGRNKPGFDFIENMSRNYPSLSLEWLVTGKGKMYKNSTTDSPVPVFSSSAGDLFADSEDYSQSENKPVVPPVKTKSASPAREIPASKTEFSESNILVESTKKTVSQKSISKIVIFYDDNTYQELK